MFMYLRNFHPCSYQYGEYKNVRFVNLKIHLILVWFPSPKKLNLNKYSLWY